MLSVVHSECHKLALCAKCCYAEFPHTESPDTIWTHAAIVIKAYWALKTLIRIEFFRRVIQMESYILEF
jgi:hypothetical protein